MSMVPNVRMKDTHFVIKCHILILQSSWDGPPVCFGLTLQWTKMRSIPCKYLEHVDVAMTVLLTNHSRGGHVTSMLICHVCDGKHKTWMS